MSNIQLIIETIGQSPLADYEIEELVRLGVLVRSDEGYTVNRVIAQKVWHENQALCPPMYTHASGEMEA